MENLVGRMLNRYQISSLLGEGGMGAVYRAHDATLQRDVAIKVMHETYAHQPDFQERFLQEARTAARLDNPGIVQVYDFGQDRGLLYIVMKFILGDNLEKMLRDLRAQNRWIPLHEAVNMIRQVATALEYAHKQNVLHRDLKPGNIMIEPEPSDGLPYRPVITDLGCLIFEWRGQPIWIVKRSQAVLKALPTLDGMLRDPKSDNPEQQPAYIKGELRSIKPEISVLVGLCTHLGCSPEMKAEIRPEPFDSEWKGGYFCPCHKSKFDMAGRVFQGVPAPTNLVVPPHYYADDNTIVIGVDPQGAA